MNVSELIQDALGRVHELVPAVVDGLTEEQLAARIDPEANSIGWLVWHLIRVQDDHVASVAGVEQVWTAGGWFDRFGLPFERAALGYGQTSADVAMARIADPALLTGYADAVQAMTVEFLSSIDETALDQVVDTSWDPPVTLGVRLVSVISDTLQHIGQAAFARGIIERRGT